MVNKVTLIGRLGSDPEIRTLESGVAVGRFSVATSENYKDRSGEWQEQTEWHDVVVWRQAAERAQRSLHKGVMVYVEGKLTHRKWQDKEGNNRKTTEVVANYFRVLVNPNAGEGGPRPSLADAPPVYTPENNAPAAPQATAATPAQTPASQAPAAPAIDDDGEDLPF
ncbi:single-stranded DNA-binding protein [Lewinella sp. 4G2]|uniref:single-stranded DNA-binding protein n=1 Tax=Lewinella sp. 4G2 TaxID=1803372 RepID=UPI0007B4E6E7|nr:single-stranded DNA-binding protein [Lewinella sp. 4G2]OAV43858.1 single-stranded DNA-binding protein [Lewinella sp. 4G2]